jgi:hypothetical protein
MFFRFSSALVVSDFVTDRSILLVLSIHIPLPGSWQFLWQGLCYFSCFWSICVHNLLSSDYQPAILVSVTWLTSLFLCFRILGSLQLSGTQAAEPPMGGPNSQLK